MKITNPAPLPVIQTTQRILGQAVQQLISIGPLQGGKNQPSPSKAGSDNLTCKSQFILYYQARLCSLNRESIKFFHERNKLDRRVIAIQVLGVEDL